MKNTRGKARSVSDPYEVYKSGGWEWLVLKHYQSAENERGNRQYARVYCMVHGFFDESGDVYCKEIPGYNWNWDREETHE